MRILIADDHEIFLESLSMMIATFPAVEVVGNCKNGVEVLEFLSTNSVDLLVTDYQMPLLSGIDLTLQIRKKYPNVKVFNTLSFGRSRDDSAGVSGGRMGLYDEAGREN
jgi:DNA-binding NarL/FixJ family response regulator